MDDERSRDFWERALRQIRDDGFFTFVQTAEPPPEVTRSVPLARRRRASNGQLILMVLVVAFVLAVIVINWLAPALF